jgi:hypothetical protein
MKYEGFKISKESVDKVFPKKDIDITGWESPIDVVMGQMRMERETTLEGDIYRAVQEYGITVDRNELILALQYDRNQYNKGFANGYHKGASDVAREIFEEIEREIKLALKINNEEKNKLICSFFSYRMLSVLDSKIEVLQAASKVITELKKKYESEGEG